ncbi:hypothetical protein [Mesorhizobium shangrilense]|uniref:DUF3035 domain-containing protein n=1 Tax=Mesorhizobium shangrilense TaxID=460060 RepID=A0ABV2D8V2_9HYPH
MTIDIGDTVFSGTGRFCCAGLAIMLLAISGCSSTSMEASTPVAGVEGPKDTATFPNLNIPPKVAAPQFTDAEKTAKLAQLKADERAQAAKKSGVKPTNPAELTALAKQHGGDTLKQIEGKCDLTLDPTCK